MVSTIMGGIGTTAMGFLQWRREIRLNVEYSTGKWEFRAREQEWRSVDTRLLRGNTKK